MAHFALGLFDTGIAQTDPPFWMHFALSGEVCVLPQREMNALAFALTQKIGIAGQSFSKRFHMKATGLVLGPKKDRVMGSSVLAFADRFLKNGARSDDVRIDGNSVSRPPILAKAIRGPESATTFTDPDRLVSWPRVGQGRQFLSLWFPWHPPRKSVSRWTHGKFVSLVVPLVVLRVLEIMAPPSTLAPACGRVQKGRLEVRQARVRVRRRLGRTGSGSGRRPRLQVRR